MFLALCFEFKYVQQPVDDDDDDDDGERKALVNELEMASH